MPSSRRPRKSSPYISANPPITKGLSSPSTSSPKSASSSIRPPSFVCSPGSEQVNARAQLGRAHDLLVCVVQLLAEFGQPTAVPDDLILDIPFQVPHLGNTALKQCMQNDFLRDGVNMMSPKTASSRRTSGDIFFPYLSDRNCIVRPTFNKYSEATPVSTSNAIFDVPTRRV